MPDDSKINIKYQPSPERLEAAVEAAARVIDPTAFKPEAFGTEVLHREHMNRALTKARLAIEVATPHLSAVGPDEVVVARAALAAALTATPKGTDE